MKAETVYLCLGCGAKHTYARPGPVHQGCPLCRCMYLKWLNYKER